MRQCGRGAGGAWWLALVALAGALMPGCQGGRFEGTLPDPGEAEAVAVSWGSEPLEAAWPSVVYKDDTFHLYFTSREGSYTGPLHATSEDGLTFAAASGHRVFDPPEDPRDSGVLRAAGWNSGSRFHLLGDVWLDDGTEAIQHAEAPDGDEFVADAEPFLFEDPDASTGEPERYSVGSVIYEPVRATAFLSVELAGGAPAVWRAWSEDGGETWTDPEPAFDRDGIPGDWTGDTIGGGGMWDAAVFPDLSGDGYHALFAGATPNRSYAAGVGHAWSEDLETWTVSPDPWLLADDGRELGGLAVVADETGYWLWYTESARGADWPEDSALLRRRIE